MPEEVLRLNPQIEDHTELIKELAQRYLYLLKKRNETDFVQEQKQAIQEKNFAKMILPSTEITIEKVIAKVIKAYDCNDLNQREALQKSIEADLQNLDNSVDNNDDDDDEQRRINIQQIGNVNEEKETFDDSIKVSLFDNNMENQNLPTLEEIMSGMMSNSVSGEKRRIPHITELSVLLSKGMFPKGVFNDDDDKLDNLNKHFVMIFPTAKLQITGCVEETKFYQYFQNYATVCRNVLKRIENDSVLIDDCISEDALQNDNFRKENSLLFDGLIDFVDSKQEIGATTLEIKERFGCDVELLEVLLFLLEKQILLKVGIVNVAFIHFRYRHNWFISHLSLSQEDIQRLRHTESGKFDSELLASEW